MPYIAQQEQIKKRLFYSIFYGVFNLFKYRDAIYLSNIQKVCSCVTRTIKFSQISNGVDLYRYTSYGYSCPCIQYVEINS